MTLLYKYKNLEYKIAVVINSNNNSTVLVIHQEENCWIKTEDHHKGNINYHSWTLRYPLRSANRSKKGKWNSPI